MLIPSPLNTRCHVMTKPSSTNKPPRKPARTQAPENTTSINVTGALISTPVVAALALGDYLKSAHRDLDSVALTRELRSQCDLVNQGDLKRPEAILLSQAFTLDAMFIEIARRAATYAGQIEPFERLLRLAFKAQSQSRATLETLASMKNPPVVLARQANISTGPQQVNNGVAVTPAREIQIAPNKLLESDDGKWLDPRAACAPSRVDQAMAPVGTIDRAKDA